MAEVELFIAEVDDEIIRAYPLPLTAIANYFHFVVQFEMNIVESIWFCYFSKACFKFSIEKKKLLWIW